MTPDQAQQIIEQGHHAAAVLESEHFMAVVDQQTNYHMAAIVAARPVIDRDAIDYHHSIQHALSELVALLRGQVDAGKAMEKALADAADEQEDDFDL